MGELGETYDILKTMRATMDDHSFDWVASSGARSNESASRSSAHYVLE